MSGQILWKIISGGQEGVEVAALDAAMSRGRHWGGFSPKSKLFGSGEPIPSKYFQHHSLFSGTVYDGLVESDSNSYAEWATNNTKNSDATLILCPKDMLTMGASVHKKYCEKNWKPCALVDPSEIHNSRRAARWISNNKIRTLNITGPSPIKSKDIYQQSLLFINEMLTSLFMREQYGIDAEELLKKGK